MDVEHTLVPGAVLLGRYRVEEKIGEGGVAVIYKATDIKAPTSAPPVVLKVIKPELTTSPEIVRQFAQETSVGRALHHPNIVEFLDLGDDEDMLMMVLEFIAGKDLGALVHRVARTKRVLRPELVAYIGIKVAMALECSHGNMENGQPAPLIHRDVSPQNILLAFDGRVKLADFGMARALNMARQTQFGVIKGKLSYMSPEQSTGADVDARADIFSLGVVMWESICARRLFLKKKQIETIFAVRDAKAPPLSKVAPHVPSSLAVIVHKALEKNKGDRYQSASEMVADLADFLASCEPVDQEALSGVLGAYFPDEHAAAKAAEPALSFDDETDDAQEFDIDDAPPPVDEKRGGLVAAATVMIDRDAMAADLEKAMEEAMKELEKREQAAAATPSKPPQPQQPGVQQPVILDQPKRQPQPTPMGGYPAGYQQQGTPAGGYPAGYQQQQPNQGGGYPAGYQQPGTPAGGYPAGYQQPGTPAGGYPMGQQQYMQQPQHPGQSGGWPAGHPQAGQSGGWPSTQGQQGYHPQGHPSYSSMSPVQPKKRSLLPLLMILFIGLPLSGIVALIVFWLLQR
jgi:serine/threonine protein kinase